MPNLPLQTFRAVEGAHPGFTSTVTLASQPFVIHHQKVFDLTAADTASFTGQTATFETLATTRFFPWTARNADSCYPVAIPNAYNRVYIYPMWLTSTDDTANQPYFEIGTYIAPYIMPFGLFPETRGYATANKLNPKMYRFPDDVITNVNTSDVVGSDTRTNGLWSVLPAYGANYETSNGAITSAANTLSMGRATGLVGASYLLPDDFSISSATTSALASTTPLASNSTSITGMGTEYQTLGCQELVVSLGSNPSGLTIGGSAKVVAKKYRAHFFLMGVFLG